MLTNSELIKSDVIANSSMNRSRGLQGVNSYGEVLKFNPLAWLEQRVQENGHALWYDACCGEGKALTEARANMDQFAWGEKVKIVGVDLAGNFLPYESPFLTFVQADVMTFEVPEPADLITCVHGLHYLGDKLRFLQESYRRLADNGFMTGQLDTDNIRCPGQEMTWTQILRRTNSSGLDIKLYKNVLSFQKSEAPLHFDLTYCGATVSERANYTGNTVIDSWYSLES